VRRPAGRLPANQSSFEQADRGTSGTTCRGESFLVPVENENGSFGETIRGAAAAASREDSGRADGNYRSLSTIRLSRRHSSRRPTCGNAYSEVAILNIIPVGNLFRRRFVRVPGVFRR